MRLSHVRHDLGVSLRNFGQRRRSIHEKSLVREFDAHLLSDLQEVGSILPSSASYRQPAPQSARARRVASGLPH